jgi:hypothetical protein
MPEHILPINMLQIGSKPRLVMLTSLFTDGSVNWFYITDAILMLSDKVVTVGDVAMFILNNPNARVSLQTTDDDRTVTVATFFI